MSWELSEVEKPFVAQLVGMGWRHIEGDIDDPAVTGRARFAQVVQESALRAKLMELNTRDGQPWLDDERISQAVNAITRIGAAKLMEANRIATDLLPKGITVNGRPDWDGGRGQTIQYLDWAHLDRNQFTVIGNKPLFHTNQLLIASSFDQTRVGCIGGLFEHFTAWKTVVPRTEAEVAARLGKTVLSEQERTITGMLDPSNLFDIIRHFTLFMSVGGQTLKAVCRYPQFRAVNGALARLRTGKTRIQDGEHDRRGGIVWHTQGSGNSLTMVFLVRKLAHPTGFAALQSHRGHRPQGLAGATCRHRRPDRRAGGGGDQRRQIEGVGAPRQGPGLVFAMIQKYRANDLAGEPQATPARKAAESSPPSYVAPLSAVLNSDDAILVLVDEAHRSHGNDLHAYLMAGIPNAAKIDFTGTPGGGARRMPPAAGGHPARAHFGRSCSCVALNPTPSDD